MDYKKEVRRLIEQRAIIDQKIRDLTNRSLVHDNVKLDTIKTKGPQFGKWAVSYKYQHIRWHGATRTNEPGEKWVALYYCDTREEAIQRMPKAIAELQALYDELQKKDEG